jgi:hypothetical protein
VALAIALFWPEGAAAQTVDAWPGRMEVSFGGTWVAGRSLGTAVATLRTNQMPSQGFTLFSAATERQAGPELAGRVGWRIGRRFTLEARGGFSRPELETAVASDAEAAAARIAQRLTRYAVDGGVSIDFPGLAAGGRARPYVTLGAGVVRELYAGHTLGGTGATAHAGAGVRWLMISRAARAVNGVGVRVDGRVSTTRGGLSFGAEEPILSPSVEGSVFLVF